MKRAQKIDPQLAAETLHCWPSCMAQELGWLRWLRLDMADYEIETGAPTIRRGKGNKDRVGYASNDSKEALDAWLLAHGNEPGPLFVPINKGGNMTLRRMTDHAVWKMVQKRALEAGVKKFSPRDLRRTFCSDLLDLGADIAVVQQLAGHSNIGTTARYDRRGEAPRRRQRNCCWCRLCPVEGRAGR